MPTEEVKGMMDIIAKLNESANTEPTAAQKLKNEKNKPTVNKLAVGKNANGMLKILQKLDEATTKVTKEIIQESHNDIELSVLNRKGNSVKVDTFEIVLDKQEIFPGMKKTFYNIKEGDKIIFKQLSLFETAMGVVKGLLFENDSKISRLIELDSRYLSALTEAALHKVKCRTLTEGYKLDIAMAKQGSAISKMKSIKNQIKSSL